MAASAGKTIKAEIMMEPIIFIPMTMVTAVSRAISRLRSVTGAPEALAKAGSKVTEKIW